MPRKKRQSKPDPSEPKQYNLKFSGDFARGPEGIDDVSDVLGLEPTQLLRMVIREHWAEYQARARRIRGDQSAAAGE